MCIFENREKAAVVAHVKMMARMVEGMGGGKWENEAVVFLRISEEGDGRGDDGVCG